MMTQKSKNIFLIVGFILFVLVAYRFAFSKTLELKSDVGRLEHQTENLNNISRLSANLSQREKFADSIFDLNNIKNTSIQNNLLEFLNDQSNKDGFSISSFSEPHTVKVSEITKTSYRFVLQGDFSSLLNVVYQLEQDYNFGKISHVNFEKKRDHRKRKDYLECLVIMESFVSR